MTEIPTINLSGSEMQPFSKTGDGMGSANSVLWIGNHGIKHTCALGAKYYKKPVTYLGEDALFYVLISHILTN
jgi:hypothetical protein